MGFAVALAFAGSVLRAENAYAAAAPIHNGDLIVSTGDDKVSEYTPDGTLVQTLMSSADGLQLPTGSAFDNKGNLYVTDFSGNQILKLTASTGAVSVFATSSTLGGGHNFDSPESVVFNQNYSEMFVSDANRFGAAGGIHVISTATGKELGFYPLPSSNGSQGNGEADWLAFDKNSTLYMTNENAQQGVMQINTTSGDIVQPSFVPNLPTYGYAMSFDKNGNLWLGDTGSILEYSPSGSLINTIGNPSFGTIFAAIFNPAGDLFYAGDLSTGTVYEYDLSGNLIKSFQASSGIDGLSVAGGASAVNGAGTAIDPVVNNVDHTLVNKAPDNGAEPSIAVDPANSQHIAIIADSSADRWPGNADLFYSSNGGLSWVKKDAIPPPPGVSANNCPCDATITYGRGHVLYATVLANGEEDTKFFVFHSTSARIYTASNTGDPTNPSDWHWRRTTFGLGGAQRTDSPGNQDDQPWVEVVRSTSKAGQDNAYVAYDHLADCSREIEGCPVDEHVAASYGAQPPNMAHDAIAGNATAIVNPAFRLAGDPRTGYLYALHQDSIRQANGKRQITYILNRGTSDGASWGLNNAPDGITVASVAVAHDGAGITLSPFDKINLTQGMLAVAVDPRDGSVYCVYGVDTSGNGYRDGLAVRHVAFAGQRAIVGPQHLIVGGLATQLPAAAVNSAGHLGVLFDEYHNPSVPREIAVEAAISGNGGATFADSTVASFNLAGSHDRPANRPLGDYQQLRAVGQTFFGTFAASRGVFSSSTSLGDRIDPAFVSFSG